MRDQAENARLDSLKAQLTPTQFVQLLMSRREVARQMRRQLRQSESMKGGRGWQPEE